MYIYIYPEYLSIILYLQDEIVPGPLPLGVAVIDLSISLFGQIFPRVANKHRLQMLDHFSECIKHTKSGRQEAIQMNVFTAVLSGLKGLNEAKTGFGQEDVKKSATNLIIVKLYDLNILFNSMYSFDNITFIYYRVRL